MITICYYKADNIALCDFCGIKYVKSVETYMNPVFIRKDVVVRICVFPDAVRNAIKTRDVIS